MNIPLAEKLRPTKLSDVVGQEELTGKGGILQRIIAQDQPVNLIFWGPPGVGKTTLARIVANELSADFVGLSAVTSGKKDITAVIERARQNWNLQLRTLLFVDEIHRFNKAQQDGFLPHVESGLITLIGATTENPSFEVISPLLSRSRVIVLKPLDHTAILKVLKRALTKEKATKRITPKALDLLATITDGDARLALGTLELALGLSEKITPEIIQQAAGKKLPRYDKGGEMHYDVISAFIKSMRGSDEKAALYYMARMLNAGEDPKFIARRMVVFASEDIGLVGNGALSLAVAAFEAVERVGLPEANYALFHAATALARAEKSREIVSKMSQAFELAEKHPNAKVPLHLRNAPTKLMKNLDYGKGYEKYSDKSYLPDEIK